MSIVAEILIAVLLVVASVFGLVGSYGLIKLKDPMTRLHAPTKATTLGVGSVLISSMLYFLLLDAHITWHELMITLFLFLSAPITAHFIAKVNLRRHVKRDELSKATDGRDWSGFATDGAQVDAPDETINR